MRSGPVPDINQEEKLKGVKSVYTLLSISSITPCRIIRCPNIQGQVSKNELCYISNIICNRKTTEERELLLILHGKYSAK